MIHIYQGAEAGSKQASANLWHESTWSSFHLQVEYRWLDKKFVPRTEDKRDAGILFHIHSEPKKVWPPSLEMQMGDGSEKAEFILNGKTLNVIQNMKFQDADGEWKPLEKGHISIQAEWDELDYRAVRVKEIEK